MRLLIILFGCFLFSCGQEKVLFFQTDWGNQSSWDAFCESAKASGYDGVELWLPTASNKWEAIKERLKLNH
ncbi:MAG: hypothetical protein R2814_08405 [Flavobacteriaceae bacterium]